MNSIRPSAAFAALACASLGIAVLGTPLAGHAQTTTTLSSPPPSASANASASASPTPSPSDSAVAGSPAPRPTPIFRLKPVIFATQRPATPHPKLTRKPVRHKATPKPFFVPTIRPSHVPTRALTAPVPAPTSSVTPTPSPSPKPTPSPTTGPTATASAAHPAAQRRAPSSASPSVSPSAMPTAVATSAPTDNGPTPIPTQPPTPRPLAPNQPTVPQSMEDANVQGIMARPIRELAQIGWMQGVWNVTGVTNHVDGASQPIKPTTYVFSPIMKSRWMFGADGNAKDYIYLTFDPFTRRWVALRFGDNPAYGMWQSDKGWVGNRIDFITNFSYVNGRQYRRRLTIIHKDARTFGIYELEQTPDGAFIPDDAYEFKKQ